MLVYHGSKNDFEVFNFDHIRGNGSEFGVGFYTTTNKDLALIYAKPYLYTYEFVGQKSFKPEERQLTRDDIRLLIEHIQEETDFLSNYGEVDFEGYEKVLNLAIDNIFNEEDDDIDMLAGIACTCGDEYALVYNAIYELFGFDSIIATMRDSELFIALVPQAVKLVDKIVIERD